MPKCLVLMLLKAFVKIAKHCFSRK